MTRPGRRGWLAVAGGAIVLAVAGALVGWWLAGDGESSTRDAGSIPFALTAIVRVEASAPGQGTTVSSVEWAWRDAEHWAWTIRQGDRVAAMLVADGERLWSYSGTDGLYRELPVDAFGDGRALPVSLVIGPTGQSSLSGVMASLQQGGRFDRMDTGGQSSVAGLPCQELRMSPVWRGEAGSSSSDGAPTTVATSGGEEVVCVETEHFFVLRNRVTGMPEALTEVTELRFEAPDRDTFRFEPPSGAQKAP